MDEITPSGVTAPAEGGAETTSTTTSSTSTAGDSPTPSGTTSTPPESTAGSATADVQGATDTDPLQGVPSLDELNQLPDTAQYKKSLIQLRTAYESLSQQHQPLAEKFKVFEPAADRFQSGDELQQVLDIHDSLLGWQTDPESGVPIPATEAGAQKLAELYPQHADYLTADLLSLPTRDPETGQTVPRIDIVLAGMAADPAERAKALKILGGVEPSSVAPQWAATAEELENVKPELQDFYKTLPWEDRDELKALSPEYLNKTLAQMKLTDDLRQERQQNQQREQQRTQQREQYVNQQAQAAGETYLSTQLNSALTTFHESVVQQCQFIQPLDPANLPQGVTPEQATQMNAQIAASNKAEAAQITGTIVGLLNPQVRSYIVPLLKETGVIDDKFLSELDRAASAFGANGRNYGNLQYRGQLGANGNGYTPTADVTQLNNEASRALKTMIGYANQLKGKLMERRSQFFELRAQQHNATLNGGAQVRPPINGQGFNPTTAAPSAPSPTGRLTLAEMQRLYG